MNNINKTKIIKNISIGLGVLTTMGASVFLIVKYSRPTDPFDAFYYEAKKLLTKKDGFYWDGNKLSFSSSKEHIDLDNSNTDSRSNIFELKKNDLLKKIYENTMNSRLSIDFEMLRRLNINDFDTMI
ncbi:MAG: hypothetical protein E7Y34_02985, partial [Mycoplasma sp.]|nr:hypothetical protein [Mycoplasma sp.]